MNLIEDLKQLQQMRAQGVLTDAEFAAAKSHILTSSVAGADFFRLLQTVAGRDGASEAEIRKLRLDFAVAQVDRAWELESDKYLAVASKRAPTRRSALYLLTIPTVGVVLYLIPTPIFLFQILGSLVILWGGWLYRLCLANVAAYEIAYARYRERRAAIVGDADLPSLPDLSPVAR